MPRAQLVAEMVQAWCRQKWPEAGALNGAAMASDMMAQWSHIFHPTDTGTHKYVPAERLTAELARPEGAGVYGYCRFEDGSYVLLTCDGPLAWWAGGDDDKAVWSN